MDQVWIDEAWLGESDALTAAVAEQAAAYESQIAELYEELAGGIPEQVLAHALAYADRLAREDGLAEVGAWGVPVETFTIDVHRESTRKLVEYWVHGEGAAKIRWGTPGSMKRCIRHLRKHVALSPGGLCAEYHRLATGEWPTEHGKAGIPS